MPEPKTILLGDSADIAALPSILVVEHDLTLSQTLVYNLSREGYRTQLARTGVEAIAMNRSMQPDLILLDTTLPGLGGLDVCSAIRSAYTVPIIMVTAKDDEVDRVLGLEMGADDYIVKPFSLRELVARIRAILRRVEMMRGTGLERTLVYDQLQIDPNSRSVQIEGVSVHLLPREFDLLLYLARNRGVILSRQQLMEKVWGHDFYGDSRTVDVHVRRLRMKIERDPAEPELIRTMYGVGYTFDGKTRGRRDAQAL